MQGGSRMRGVSRAGGHRFHVDAQECCFAGTPVVQQPDFARHPGRRDKGKLEVNDLAHFCARGWLVWGWPSYRPCGIHYGVGGHAFALEYDLGARPNAWAEAPGAAS
ncbi:hypothetical protein G6F65_017536 [Rhizopus arrhizus]|nr:hypothetical protein G6F65_017536 [Rhizopus arrhizus]